MSMPAVRTLYRPVGLCEMERILEAGARGFPPRRKEQPIFYPVLVQDYAEQIARRWNTTDRRSGFAGFVTRLQIADEVRTRRRGVYRAVQSPGAQQTGYCSIRLPSAGAGQVVGVGLSFVPVLANTPTGLSFTAITSTNVSSGPSVTPGSMTPYGCEVTVTAAASGAVVWTGKYTTIGA